MYYKYLKTKDLTRFLADPSCTIRKCCERLIDMSPSQMTSSFH